MSYEGSTRDMHGHLSFGSMRRTRDVEILVMFAVLRIRVLRHGIFRFVTQLVRLCNCMSVSCCSVQHQNTLTVTSVEAHGC